MMVAVPMFGRYDADGNELHVGDLVVALPSPGRSDIMQHLSFFIKDYGFYQVGTLDVDVAHRILLMDGTNRRPYLDYLVRKVIHES